MNSWKPNAVTCICNHIPSKITTLFFLSLLRAKGSMAQGINKSFFRTHVLNPHMSIQQTRTIAQCGLQEPDLSKGPFQSI